MKELLEAGVHFGHQTKRWNPKMKHYIFGARNGIYIIDLQRTVAMFKTAYDFILNTVADGKPVLFVGTKKQARESIYEEANRCEMFYVHNRWLGGMLTNFQTIRQSINRLNYLNEIQNDGSINVFPKKERLKLAKERLSRLSVPSLEPHVPKDLYSWNFESWQKEPSFSFTHYNPVYDNASLDLDVKCDPGWKMGWEEWEWNAELIRPLSLSNDAESAGDSLNLRSKREAAGKKKADAPLICPAPIPQVGLPLSH